MKNGSWRKVAAVLAGCALVVVGTDAVTYSATGNSLILGKINKAPTTTTLNNLGRGPVLNLIGGKANPPLKVNSKKKVANLNADSVDGKDSLVLEPNVRRLTTGADGSVMPAVYFFTTTIPAGWYIATLNGVLESTVSADNYTCLLGDRTKILAGDSSGIWGFSGASFTDTGGGWVDSGQTVYVPAGVTVIYGCSTGATGIVTQKRAVTATFRPVTVSSKAATPYTPSPRAVHRLATH